MSICMHAVCCPRGTRTFEKLSHLRVAVWRCWRCCCNITATTLATWQVLAAKAITTYANIERSKVASCICILMLQHNIVVNAIALVFAVRRRSWQRFSIYIYPGGWLHINKFITSFSRFSHLKRAQRQQRLRRRGNIGYCSWRCI